MRLRTFAAIAAMACFATPVLAEKGDIFNCTFKTKRGQFLVEQVVVGVGHASKKAMVYDRMIHYAHGKPIQSNVARNDKERMVLNWTVLVKDSNGSSSKVKMKLTYIKKNKRAMLSSNVAGYLNHDTAQGKCKTSVGNV